MELTQGDLRKLNELYREFEATDEEDDDARAKLYDHFTGKVAYFWPDIYKLLNKAIEEGWN